MLVDSHHTITSFTFMLTEQGLRDIFADFDNKRILIIGDVMIDAYLWGDVNRISPEAPVPIISCTKREYRLGGAANVILNVKAMGATPVVCSVIGDDEKGQTFFELLNERGLETQGVMVDQGRKTTVKTRVISGDHHLLRVDDEITDPLTGELGRKFAEHTIKVLEQGTIDAIIFQDYDKGVITPYLINEVVDYANSKGIPTLVDPKKRNFKAYHNVSLFKPNFKEFVEGFDLPLKKGDIAGLHKAAIEQQLKANNALLFVTLSELGVFISNKVEYWHVPAHIRSIADVSGAGDTVISVASLCLVAGMQPNELAAISNLAGGIVCEKVGVVSIDKAQLLNESIKYLIK